MMPFLKFYWFAAHLPTTTSEETETVCVSEELASTVHPSEATWICEYRTCMNRVYLPCDILHQVFLVHDWSLVPRKLPIV